MVLRGNIGIRRYWFGVLPLYVGHLLEAENYKKSRTSFVGTSLEYEYLKQGKYITRNPDHLSCGQSELTLSGAKTYTLHSREGRLVGGRNPCAGKEE
jgi:hypothetical protein